MGSAHFHTIHNDMRQEQQQCYCRCCWVSCWEDGTCSLIQPPPKKLLLLPSWSFVEHDGGNWLKKNHHEKSILACMCTYILLALLLYHHVLNTHCWVIILVFSRLWIFEAQIAFLGTTRILCQKAIFFILFSSFFTI